MQLTSQSFASGQPIPERYAVGKPGGYAANQNPHLAWTQVPKEVQSFSLSCIDIDVPTQQEMVGRSDVQIPENQPRREFIHWVMADIPSATRDIPAGSCSQSFVVGGKRHPSGPAGARQGLNDYTEWLASHPEMRGDYWGYDGPYPPENDLRIHRYYFHVSALDVAKLELPERWTGAHLRQAMEGHVIAEAVLFGTYTLHPKRCLG